MNSDSSYTVEEESQFKLMVPESNYCSTSREGSLSSFSGNTNSSLVALNVTRRTLPIHSFFFIRILFFRPRLNIPIFLPILG